MTKRIRDRRSGQVIIMVTLALIVLCGMMGLAVDLGWSYFVEKSAQAAADAAALAAVKTAMEGATGIDAYTCAGPSSACVSPPAPCSAVAGTNLESACIYAARHGFSSDDPRQNVLVEASDANTPPTVLGCNPQVSHPPTAPCVDVFYWVTVRVSQSIPQLFSAVLGNSTGMVSARATAAVAQAEHVGSLILINRQNEQWVQDMGTNLYLSGGPTVNVPGGILLASNADGTGGAGHAGYISGGGDVVSPFTHIRTGGSHAISGGGSWIRTPGNRNDGAPFYDPYRDRLELHGHAQPPVTTNNLPAIPVPGGSLNTTICPGGVCGPGNYFATRLNNQGQMVASGAPILITRGTWTFEGGSFGDFHFFGGIDIPASSQADVYFGPGRYVLAGLDPPQNTDKQSPILFNISNKTTLLSTSWSDAGRIFIYTDTQYPGLQQHVDAAKAVVADGSMLDALQFGRVDIQAGSNADSRVELFGLNKEGAGFPSELEGFTPVVMWQDQRDSYVKYTDGQVDYTSCGDGFTLDNPCPGAVAPPSSSPELKLMSTPFTRYDGAIYQPRGAWTWLQASGQYMGPLRIVSGALWTRGSGSLTLTGDARPILTYVTALVE